MSGATLQNANLDPLVTVAISFYDPLPAASLSNPTAAIFLFSLVLLVL